MSSIWTDLLFLHGHFARKEDLVWRTDSIDDEQNEAETNRSHPTAIASPAPKRRLFRWPRLSAPH